MTFFKKPQLYPSIESIGNMQVLYDKCGKLYYFNHSFVIYDVNEIANLKFGTQENSHVEYQNNQIIAFGDLPITYNKQKRLKSIGDEEVSYHPDGRIKSIGEKEVKYSNKFSHQFILDDFTALFYANPRRIRKHELLDAQRQDQRRNCIIS